MKRFQLFGRSKYFSLTSPSSVSSVESSEERFPTIIHNEGSFDSNQNHRNNNNDISGLDTTITLLSLPDKILCKILVELDLSTLLKLCHLNSRLYSIITNEFLFNHPRRNIKLFDKMALLKFNALIHAEFKTANMLRGYKNYTNKIARFLVTTIEFVNPQCQDSLLKYSRFYNKQDHLSLIGGSFNLDSITSSPSSITNSYYRTNNTQSISKNKKASQTIDLLDKLEIKYSHYTYIELMLDIIDYLPNLMHVKLTQIDKNFKIPLWYSVFNDGSKEFMKKIIRGQQSITIDDLRTFQISDSFAKQYECQFYSLQRIKRLELQGALENGTDVTVPLRSNLLCCFGIITELILENLVIDKLSLDTPMEFLPLYLRKEIKINNSTVNNYSDSGSNYSDNRSIHHKMKHRQQCMESLSYTVNSTYTALTLKSCNIIAGNGILRLFQSYFKDVKRLSLFNLLSKYDLLIVNCFPSLTDLTIDCNSKCFIDEMYVPEEYYYDQRNVPMDPYNESSLHSDCISMTETLLDDPGESILQSPPPTSFVVMSLNLNYINRTITDIQNNKRKPSMLTGEQGQFFQSIRVPAFHCFFHYYKNLWDRLPYKSININIINIPFTNVFPLSPGKFIENMLQHSDNIPNYCLDNEDIHYHSADQETLIAFRNNHEAPDYYWNSNIKQCISDILNRIRGVPTEQIESIVANIDTDLFNNYQNYKCFKDIPNLNLYYFLQSLSKFKSVKIQMLRKFVNCTVRTRYDWELLLDPVLNVNVPIEVTDKDGIKLYSYGVKR